MTHKIITSVLVAWVALLSGAFVVQNAMLQHADKRHWEVTKELSALVLDHIERQRQINVAHSNR